MERKAQDEVWLGRLARYAPPARVRRLQGTVRLNDDGLRFVGLGVISRGVEGVVAASEIETILVDNDGSIVVAWRDGDSREQHVAFWPDRRDESSETIAAKWENWRASRAAANLVSDIRAAARLQVSDEDLFDDSGSVDSPVDAEDRFSKLMSRYFLDPSVQAVLALAQDPQRREAAVRRSAGAIDDLLQRAAMGWLSILREEDAHLVPTPRAWTDLGSALYTVALVGWAIGTAWKDHEGIERTPIRPEDADALGADTAELTAQLDVEALDDWPFYCIENFRGMWINGSVLKPVGLDRASDPEESTRVLWSLGHVALTWGFCLALAEARLRRESTN